MNTQINGVLNGKYTMMVGGPGKTHPSNKVCYIINSTFSYVLKVDDVEIPFNGGSNADYFQEHYEKLGYEVHRVKGNFNG